MMRSVAALYFRYDVISGGRDRRRASLGRVAHASYVGVGVRPDGGDGQNLRRGRPSARVGPKQHGDQVSRQRTVPPAPQTAILD